MPTTKRATPDFPALLTSWHLDLTAQHKSPATVKNYIRGVNEWLRWCENNGITPELTKENVSSWMADKLSTTWQPGTARTRYSALRRFSHWLHKEGEQASNVFRDMDMTPPKLDEKVVETLTDAELKDLIKVCQGKTFEDRRDEAMFRLMAETGMRANECCSLTTKDLDLPTGWVIVRRGKGAKGREVHIEPETAAAIDRYLRLRSSRNHADTPALWLGRKGPLGYHGLYRAIKRRAKLAGIEGARPHKLRHTMATRWKASGGSDAGLMAQAGWTDPAMIVRYTKASAARLAADEAKRLRLGNI